MLRNITLSRCTASQSQKNLGMCLFEVVQAKTLLGAPLTIHLVETPLPEPVKAPSTKNEAPASKVATPSSNATRIVGIMLPADQSNKCSSKEFRTGYTRQRALKCTTGSCLAGGSQVVSPNLKVAQNIKTCSLFGILCKRIERWQLCS